MARKIKFEQKLVKTPPATTDEVSENVAPGREIQISSDATILNSDLTMTDDMDTSDDAVAGGERLRLFCIRF